MSLYSQVLEGVLLPLHNLARRRDYVRYRRLLDESQWWSCERLLSFQWKELQGLLAHVFRSVPFYQKKYALAGARLEDIRTWEDFRRLPILTRQEVNAHRAELRANDYKGKLILHSTGGSSGVPTRFYITYPSYDWRTAATQRVYSWTGCQFGERALYLWGAPVGEVSAFQALKKRTYEFCQRQLVCNTFSQSHRLWESLYARAREFRPQLLVGYVSSLDAFSRFLAEGSLVLPNVRAVIAAAEPLYSDVRERVSQAFHAPVFNTYGSREFMSLAGECERHDGLHINSENVLVETSRPPEHGPSDILVTDLHNYGMPFVRYAIGDVGLLDDTPCLCGRSLPRVRVESRTLERLRMADGRIISPIFFRHLLKDIPEMREYQIRQGGTGDITLRVVLSHELSETSASLIQTEMAKVLGARIDIERVAEIAKLPSGKHQAIVTERSLS